MKLNCCNLIDKTFMVEEVFLTDEQREWSFETESTTVEGSVRLLKWQQKNV